ncbi:MAG: 50S ribosomal protein L29 [Anaerolineae bacterium]|jgi:large subunit ribosomal protein L29|nr:50S ribosomal protein L29 [Anaerolineae bacterium]
MKASEIRALSAAEIEEKLNDAQQEMMNLRFQFVMGQITDTSRFKVVRRDIARMMTILREREIAEEVKDE